MSEIMFDALTLEDAEQIRIWRNQDIGAARTPYLLTKEMQEKWYNETVCDRSANSRYWAIRKKADEIEKKKMGIYIDYNEIDITVLIGIAGLQNIEWENRTAEISLMIGPDYRRKGYGKEALQKLLAMGFDQIGLHSIWGEVYEFASSFKYWYAMMNKHNANTARLLDRKYCSGQYYDAIWFCFLKGE